MTATILAFWILVFIVFYAYAGYGILLYLIVRLKRILSRKKQPWDPGFEPEVTLFVAAYNEKDYVQAKVENSLALDYPEEKLHLVWVTDGSDDGTPDMLKSWNRLKVYHQAERAGKIGAMNRGMKLITTPFVIFTDANTMLNRDAVRNIIRHYKDPKVGGVAGEKRIATSEKDAAAGAGEGIYWKYESALKKLDSELYSVVGAAGELFSVRTELFHDVEKDTLLDDFILTMRITQQGYIVRYEPDANATETSSANVEEELKRKIRISAGGLQSVVRLKAILNVFRYRTLSFQYISHRVLRWTLAPLALPFIFLLNLVIALDSGIFIPGFYTFLFWCQVLFYLAALSGWYLENKKVKVKVLFVPYYFFIMNLSVYLGFRRFIKGRQTVNWERAKRA
ncbi:MAG: glycosyltransferase family 2 protein [Bacteroidales bacterium]|nr:glycosyltransferase family 2 protein [Bacteroidales bacterium]